MKKISNFDHSFIPCKNNITLTPIFFLPLHRLFLQAFTTLTIMNSTQREKTELWVNECNALKIIDLLLSRFTLACKSSKVWARNLILINFWSYLKFMRCFFVVVVSTLKLREELSPTKNNKITIFLDFFKGVQSMKY